MARRKAAQPQKLWMVPVKITLNCTATVEASTVEEALARAERGEFVEDGRNEGEAIDWTVNGRAELDTRPPPDFPF